MASRVGRAPGYLFFTGGEAPAILWHPAHMRIAPLAVLLLVGLTSAGCFQMTTVMKINGDGSGTVEHRMLFTTKALAQLRQFGALGGGRGQAVDPTSEQQAREMATTLGPDVSYVSSTPVKTPGGEGRDAIYAFSDVAHLRVATQPAAPGGLAIRTPGLTDGEALTFSMTRDPNGNAVLHVNVPENALVQAIASNAATLPQQLPMIRMLLAGAHITLMVEPAGAIVRASTPYVDGPRVTLLEVDLDQVLKDPDALLARVQAAKTVDEIKAALKDVPGLKMALEREITIEFTPPAR
jgi:hypothetical protein